MKITAEFNSMEEMQEFAKTVVCGVQVPAEKPKPTKKKEPAPEEKPAPATTEAPAEDSKENFTKEEVRAKLAALNKSGKREKVRELLKEFGVTTLPEVKPEDYPALMAKAGEL